MPTIDLFTLKSGGADGQLDTCSVNKSLMMKGEVFDLPSRCFGFAHASSTHNSWGPWELKTRSLGSKSWRVVCRRKDVSGQSLVSRMVSELIFTFDKWEYYSYPDTIRRFTVLRLYAQAVNPRCNLKLGAVHYADSSSPPPFVQSQMDRVL